MRSPSCAVGDPPALASGALAVGALPWGDPGCLPGQAASAPASAQISSTFRVFTKSMLAKGSARYLPSFTATAIEHGCGTWGSPDSRPRPYYRSANAQDFGGCHAF